VSRELSADHRPPADMRRFLVDLPALTPEEEAFDF
jgi:hypothetical protein